VPLRVFDFNQAVVRRPGKSVVNGLRAHSGPGPEFARVVSEQEAYISALETAGVQVTTLAPLEQFPDSMFVEDPALAFTGAAILLRPGAPTRRAEALELAPELERRFPAVLQLGAGHADGGDILVTPGCVFIGLSVRTDPAGAAALADLLNEIGLKGKAVEVPSGTLHLKSDCALLDEETVLATAELAASGLFDGMRVLVAPTEERHACNALRVNDTVFVRAGCPRTAEMLSHHGLNVSPLSVSEIAKIDAGLSCMSLRWFSRMAA
jgi:dimethylargininase